MGLLGNLLSDALTKGVGKAAEALEDIKKKTETASWQCIAAIRQT